MLHAINHLLIAYGPLGILLLAFVDSAGVPIPAGMDALVIFLSAKSPGNAVWYALLGVLGSAAGNVTLFWVARHGGRRFLDRKAPAARTRRFRAWFLRYGLLTVFVPALIPIPLPMKVFVISAGALQVPIGGFIAVVLLARIMRFGAEAWLGAEVGEHSASYITGHARELALIAVALFILLYVLVRFSDRRSGSASDVG